MLQYDFTGFVVTKFTIYRRKKHLLHQLRHCARAPFILTCFGDLLIQIHTYHTNGRSFSLSLFYIYEHINVHINIQKNKHVHAHLKLQVAKSE